MSDSEGEDGAFKAVELKERDAELFIPVPQTDPQLPPPKQGQPDTLSKETTEAGSASVPGPEAKGNRWASVLDQFRIKRFFVLRPGTWEHALEEVKCLVNKEEDGNIRGVWLLAEVDHWNNERERVVLVTDKTLLICKYDFMMLTCEQILRVPLNFVDRIVHGGFRFPPHSLITREGEGVRLYWDKLREPAFSSRWNPFATDYPFCTFTYHPVRSVDEKFAALCEIQNFREQLTKVAREALTKSPFPGKANGVMVLNQPILIEAYIGLMSSIGNKNQLGYSLARSNLGL